MSKTARKPKSKETDPLSLSKPANGQSHGKIVKSTGFAGKTNAVKFGPQQPRKFFDPLAGP
jgi:hypothetical protein